MTAAIIPLSDGGFQMATALFPDLVVNAATVMQLLGKPVPATIHVPVWAFAICTPEGWVLIDAGGGDLMGAGFGGVAGALLQAGIAPADVVRVYLTHLHGDHCGGLLTADGTAAFPAARVAVPLAEIAYWMDNPSSDIARDALRALAPYEGHIDSARPGDVIGAARAIDAAGHTPGHMAWAFDEANAVGAGDIMHLPQVQLRHPGWGCIWDMDPVSATAARRRMMTMARQTGAKLLCGHGGQMEVPDQNWMIQDE